MLQKSLEDSLYFTERQLLRQTFSRDTDKRTTFVKVWNPLRNTASPSSAFDNNAVHRYMFCNKAIKQMCLLSFIHVRTTELDSELHYDACGISRTNVLLIMVKLIDKFSFLIILFLISSEVWMLCISFRWIDGKRKYGYGFWPAFWSDFATNRRAPLK